MLIFIWKFMLLLLPLPWLVRMFSAPVARTSAAALRVPSIDDFLQADALRTHSRASRRAWLALLAWCALVAAAARPEWQAQQDDVPISGRDLLLLVDLSRSMEQHDFELNGQWVNRLVAVKAIASRFIEQRIGDRVGLILFGERPYLQSPLTFDRETVKTFLLESQIGMAGDATAIGDAIGLAVKRLADKTAAGQQRVLILLTDGRNTAGELQPLQAAQIAARAGWRIYTIGIGADEAMINLPLGMNVPLGRNSDLDEATLTAIAKATGGRYFRARHTRELTDIYRLLDQIEPTLQDPKRYRPTTPLYHFPLALALACVCLLLLRQPALVSWRYG